MIGFKVEFEVLEKSFKICLILGYDLCFWCLTQDDLRTSMARGVLYLDACTHITKVTFIFFVVSSYDNDDNAKALHM